MWTQLSVHECKLLPTGSSLTHTPGFVYDKSPGFSMNLFEKKLFYSYLNLYNKLHRIGILILTLEKDDL